jgi:ribosomal protein L37AE/L43A
VLREVTMDPDEFVRHVAEVFDITEDEARRRLDAMRTREDAIAAVTDQQLRARFGPIDGVPESLLRSMKEMVAGVPPQAVRCPRCGGTGDEVRSPQGIIRCRDCGGSGWIERRGPT